MNTIIVNADLPQERISRHIYGHFAEHLGHCIYDGMWVGEDSSIPNVRGIRTDIVDAFRRIRIPNLRWPGGCFADEYHWEDGIGPRASRPRMVNTHWGGEVEDNSFGTHEFMDLCEQLGTEPYICGNVGSGSVREMSEWVEYLTSDSSSSVADRRRANGRDKAWPVRFWGVGNESWGCGGRMTAEYYADQYRRYSVYCRDYQDTKLFRIAGGANSEDYHWTNVLMREAHRHMDGLSLHYYVQTRFGSQATHSSATEFGETEWFEFLVRALRMDTLVARHSAVMDSYDPEKRVALVVDEWGTWYEVEPGTNPGFLYQQNTMRDALVAAITLDVFNAHCSRVRIANLAQAVNVLQAPILTDGPAMILTPTFHVFDLYKEHQDSALLPMSIQSERYELDGKSIDAVGGTASIDDEHTVHITLHNRDPRREQSVRIDLRGRNGSGVSGRILTAPAMNSHNTASKPTEVVIRPFDVAFDGDVMAMTLPPMSVAAVALRVEPGGEAGA